MRLAALALLIASLAASPWAWAEEPPSAASPPLARAGLPLVPQPVSASPATPPRRRATRAQRAALKNLLQKEREQLVQLQRLARDVLEAEARLEEEGRAEKTLRYRRGEAERRIKGLRKRQTETEARVQARLLRLYKLTRGRYARALAAAPSAAERTRRARLLRYVVQRDLDELATFVRERRALEEGERTIAEARRRGKARQVQWSARRAQLERAQRAQREALRRLSRQRRRKQRMVKVLSRQTRALIAELAQVRRGLGRAAFVMRRGCLAPPVRGALSRAKQGASLFRPGVLWRTRGRARVRAVHGGVVRAARLIEGFGNVVLIEHGEGYFTLYGFLSAIGVEKGQQVKAKETIGRVGIDPLSGDRALYFEVRRGAEALDAGAWIGRCPRS